MSDNERTPSWRQPVICVPLAQHFPELSGFKEFRSKKCIFSHDKSKIFNVVSQKYQPLDNGLAVDTIADALTNIFGTAVVPNVRTLNGGARIWCEFKMPDLPLIRINPKDEVALTLMMQNSYDSSCNFAASLGAFRLVCSNGAKIGKEFGAITGKHFASLAKPEAFEERLSALITKGKLLEGVWKEWEDTPIELEEAVEITKGKLAPKYLKPILVPSAFKQSKWQFYNSLTHIATHQTQSLTRRLEFDEQIASIFYK